MNYPLIFRMLSFLLWIMAGAFALCMGVSIFYDGNIAEASALTSWVTCFAIAVFFALCLYFPSRAAARKLYKKEALCAIGLGWIFCILLGSLPFALILHCSLGDAFFESASGITTTGATVFSKLETLPRSILFWRVLSHWLGGLGVVVFFVAVLSSLGAGGRLLFSRDVGTQSEGDSARIHQSAMRILYLYLGMSALCFLAYRFCGMGWFDSVCHMMSTVSTGGFSNYDNSLGHYSSAAIEWVAVLFMFVGGVNFTLLYLVVKGRFKAVRKNTELKWYAGILAFSALAIATSIIRFDSLTAGGLLDSLRTCAFSVTSVMTSTGFASADYNMWPPVAHVVIFCLLIVGGCSGSTSGGIKVVRVAVAFRMCLYDIEKSFRPRVVRTLRLNGHPLDEQAAGGTLSFIMLYAVIVIFMMLLVSIVERDLSFTGCITAVVACMSNIGPGLAEVGPANTYGFLNEASKFILGLTMIIGRLELYAILVLFMPSLWKNFQ